MKVIMKFFKSTKNTHVYKAIPSTAPVIVESIYVERKLLPTIPPQEITVSVEWVDS